LNDEKIISQPRLELVKMKCPVSRRAFSSLQAFPRALQKQERLKKRKIEFRQKTGAIPA
jgi:hypothetical protein